MPLLVDLRFNPPAEYGMRREKDWKLPSEQVTVLSWGKYALGECVPHPFSPLTLTAPSQNHPQKWNKHMHPDHPKSDPSFNIKLTELPN